MRTHATHLEAAKPRVLARLIRRIGLLISGCLLIAAPAMAQDYNERLLYDERGNLLQRSLQGRVIGYRYDGLDRLQEETAPGNQRLLLDADGNRLADGRSTYSVAQGGQRLAMRDGVALVHGPAGHLLADRTWRGGRWVQRQFDWTLDGQIKTVRLDGKTVATYHYNEARQRTRKTLATPPVGVPAITLYRYDPAGLLTLEVAGAAVQAPGVSVMPGQVLVRYLWQDAVPVAVVWPPMTPGNPNASTERIVYLHTDHLNTPRRASDARGVLVWQWISDAYGSSAPEEDPDQDGRPTTIHLRFPGQYFDVESGLHYNWNRYYDPQVGRYTQPDPIGLQGGINSYGYVAGNPMSFVDPMGLDRWGAEGGRGIVYTQMDLGRTAYYDAFSGDSFVFPSRNKVVSSSKPGAADPYSGLVAYCERGRLARAYGTAKMRTTDSRFRWIHGGGSGLSDPWDPQQGWKPTEGCTRAQNEDVDNLCSEIDVFRSRYPKGVLLYRRD